MQNSPSAPARAEAVWSSDPEAGVAGNAAENGLKGKRKRHTASLLAAPVDDR